jgi:hypothetical protein
MGIDFIIFVSNMKTLIIHPEDYTTDFLETIYYRLDNKTVLRNEFSVAQVCALIESHDRVFMMGHGSPSGLFSMGLSTEFSSFAVDHKMVKALLRKITILFGVMQICLSEITTLKASPQVCLFLSQTRLLYAMFG